MSCLISSSGKQISKERLINCFCRHENVGILLLDKNHKFQIKRSWTNFDNFYKFYSENIQTPNVIFFNGKNSWDKDKAKPFILSPNLYVFIDGHVENIINFREHKTKSEIQLFVEKVLRPIARIDDNLFRQRSISILLSKSIGKDAKLVFFYQKQKPTFIYGMSSGNLEDDGHNWFSNSDYKFSSPKKTYFYPRQQQNKDISYGGEIYGDIDLDIEEIEKEANDLLRLEQEEIEQELNITFLRKK